MFEPIFQQFGLSKNEATIYEVLLRNGESSVADISKKSNIHRRNTYDALARIIEKGLVFEILSRKEHIYQAVDPHKFMEFLKEKETVLTRAMPHLQSLYKSNPHHEEVYIYRGPEGWKNYMRDMLRVADEAFFIGAKGGWLDERVKHFYPYFQKEFAKKEIKFWHIFDHEVQTQFPEIIDHIGENYRFLPKGFSTPAAIDIFGDHVNIISNMRLGGLEEQFSITVIVNPVIASAFKTWFHFMYQSCPKT